MSFDALEDLTKKLSNTKVAGEGVSFVGKSLKLDNANDAKVVTDAIAACGHMEILNLEGNSLGVEAAKAIGGALGSHPEMKRALWDDLFTGRMKDEIPQALRYLGGGLGVANARLVELNLSNNAFGPIGMEGLVSLLRSPTCQSLQELRLNNNGLGITGAKLLSKALLDCYESSKAAGSPLPLRVFIAGRNRLENEGITALSKVFKIIGSLEEIQIPQNGIYHVGIRELSEALKRNSGLRVLNLNDNTVGPKGSTALASALPTLQLLRVLNLGDCLVRTAGAFNLAGALQLKHVNLEELILDHNEIKKEGALAIVTAMENKQKLKTLSLDGNQFGDEGISMVKKEMEKYRKPDVLGSFSEDEGEDSEPEADDDDSNYEDDVDEDDDDDDEEEEEEETNKNEVKQQGNGTSSIENTLVEMLKKVTAADFLQFPTPERFVALKSNRAVQILTEVKQHGEDKYLERLLPALMKVSSLVTLRRVGPEAQECANLLYKELFSWASTHDSLSLVNNSLLVHLGLIKCEDKWWKPEYNLAGCRVALKAAMSLNYFPQGTRDTVLCFLKNKPDAMETVCIGSP